MKYDEWHVHFTFTYSLLLTFYTSRGLTITHQIIYCKYTIMSIYHVLDNFFYLFCVCVCVCVTWRHFRQIIFLDEIAFMRMASIISLLAPFSIVIEIGLPRRRKKYILIFIHLLGWHKKNYILHLARQKKAEKPIANVNNVEQCAIT